MFVKTYEFIMIWDCNSVFMQKKRETASHAGGWNMQIIWIVYVYVAMASIVEFNYQSSKVWQITTSLWGYFHKVPWESVMV